VHEITLAPTIGEQENRFPPSAPTAVTPGANVAISAYGPLVSASPTFVTTSPYWSVPPGATVVFETELTVHAGAAPAAYAEPATIAKSAMTRAATVTVIPKRPLALMQARFEPSPTTLTFEIDSLMTLTLSFGDT
jgi:hypothetical protein